MAYSGRFNPDALPAHAEPNEAAQIIATAQSSKTKNSPLNKPLPSPGLPPSSPQVPSYQNKPPPPLPIQSTQHQSYRPHGTSNASPGLPAQEYRRHSGGNVSLAPHRTSPPAQHKQRMAPLNTNSPMPGAYPSSAGPHSPPPQQPPSAGVRPHSPLPPAGTQDPSLWPLFQAVDYNRSGELSQVELSNALKNDEYTSFDPETVRMMIKMFDGNGNGTIGYEEFCGLWGFLAAWRTLFQRFDEDRSGHISYAEYSKALVAFGYSLSSEFVNMMYRLYDRRGNETMTFDLFVQSCIQLKRMTDIFKKYDNDRDGFITLSFEEFLTEILSAR